MTNEAEIERLVRQIDALRTAAFDDEQDRVAAIETVDAEIARIKDGPRHITGVFGS